MATDFKKADSLLSVTLRKNKFTQEENSFFGRVTINTVTLENLIASIAEKNPGISSYMIQHTASLLGDEMLNACKSGNSVDFLGLGTMFISVSGAVNGENPGETNIPGFKLNFTPSAKAQESLGSLKVDKVVIADSNPAIDKIINVFDQNEKRILKTGKGVKITGSKLKVFGEDSGIWFAPVKEDGLTNNDESSWTSVSTQTLSLNKPKSLEFYVPDSLAPGQYSIVIRTRFCSGDKQLKTPVTTASKAVTVE